ncbi:tRNA pseudouridine(55) synthase TruB [Planctomonas psychrotolerans]|uniref:tRNA pseudouridine(55) synthase TruB n=1 Tax=Planctomonas psychrotolerans TaxID=2528712 RepID=UPI00123BC037|nr:tRNA pseudouridine(55) synthase TruB [Planctomonas psychrotolerans]
MTHTSAAETRPAGSGILLLDKEGGWTSHDVVARTRRLAGTRKVGHAGTLDPMATGLLLVGVNSSTRLLTYMVGLDKEYFATIRLGASTITDDREGDVLGLAAPGEVTALSAEDVEAAMATLRGEFRQVPSSVSAIKVDGKRSYARSRAGEDVVLDARAVTITAFDLLGSEVVREGDVDFLDLSVRVECSSGTYIRAIARDLGRALGVGGHLTELRRTRIGPFLVRDAVPLGRLQPAEHLIPPADAAVALFDPLHLTSQQAIDLGHGKRIARNEAERTEDDGVRPLAAIAPGGRLVGLVEFDGGVGRVVVNFPPDAPPAAPRDAPPAPAEAPLTAPKNSPPAVTDTSGTDR